MISFAEQRRARLRDFLPAAGIELAPHSDGQLDEIFAEYLREYRRGWHPFEDAVEVLKSLRERGLKTGLLTNGTRDRQMDKLTATGLLSHLDVVCISEEIGSSKPDAAAFETLARTMALSPSEIVFIGDSAAHDLAGATSVGMTAGIIRRCSSGPRQDKLTFLSLTEAVSALVP